MGRLSECLLREKYMILFYVKRAQGLFVPNNEKDHYSVYSKHTCKPENRVKKEDDDFNFIKENVLGCWNKDIVVLWAGKRLSVKRNAEKKQILFQFLDCCEFVSCENVSDFINSVNTWVNQCPNIKLYYRGQSSLYNWLPSLYRNEAWVDNESRLNDNVINKLVEEFKDCHTTIEKLIKLKHYEQPSRLMDIVGNPLIALYFACASADKNKSDAFVTVIYSNPKLEKYSNSSDTVIELSAIANNDRISAFDNMRCIQTEREGKKQECYKQPLKNIYEACLEKRGEEDPNCPVYLFLKEQAHQCKRESGIEAYWDDISLEKLDKCVIVHPVLNNIRIIHQQGLFILCGFNSTDKYMPPADYGQFFLYKGKRKIFKIAEENVSNMLEELDRIGINQSQVYFDLEKTIDYVKNHV